MCKKIYLLVIYVLLIMVNTVVYGMKSTNYPTIPTVVKNLLIPDVNQIMPIIDVQNPPEQPVQIINDKKDDIQVEEYEREFWQKYIKERQEEALKKYEDEAEPDPAFNDEYGISSVETKKELPGSTYVADIERQSVTDIIVEEIDGKQCILFVGGGNLSFELNWVKKHPGFNRSNIIVSIFENMFLDELTKENAKKLLKLGVTVLFGVDATKLHQKQEIIMVVSYDEKLNAFNGKKVEKKFSDEKIMAVFFSHPCIDGIRGGPGTGRTLIQPFMASASAAKIPVILIPRGKAGPRWEWGGSRYKQYASTASSTSFQRAVRLLSKRIYQFHATKGAESKYPIALPKGYKLVKKHNFRNPKGIIISKQEPYSEWQHTKDNHEGALDYLITVGSTCYVFKKVDDQDHEYNSDSDTDVGSEFDDYYIENPVKTFLDTIVEEYIADMRNADASQDDVLWGGEIELEAIAKLHNLRITIKSKGNARPRNVGPEDGKPITLFYDGSHYQYSDPEAAEQLDVDHDGNCLFSSILKAEGKSSEKSDISRLRNEVADYINQSEDIKNAIRELFGHACNAKNEADLQQAVNGIIPFGRLRDRAEELARQNFKLQNAKKSNTNTTSSVENLYPSVLKFGSGGK